MVVADKKLKKKLATYAWSVTNAPAKINTKELIPERSYLEELKKLTKENRYTKYLELRKDNNDPTFYFDVANMFLLDADTATAYKILSNIAEVNLDDHEACKMLGYRFKSIKRYDDEVMIFRKVVQLRPQDPQSYRDYALALADAGKFQQALDTLYLALTRQYDEQLEDLYTGIEDIILTEINELIALHGSQLNVSKIPKDLIKKMPVDVRVVLNWNMNDTDVDLWVIDPSGEKCAFDHTDTEIGGRITRDLTRGYGPEQFMLKNTIKGKYKVIVNYFGDTRQRVAGRTTVMAEIFTHYGTASAQRKVVALQMDGSGSGEVLVAEFSF
jgi:tetratricopeptide (TPR) repeat protein